MLLCFTLYEILSAYYFLLVYINASKNLFLLTLINVVYRRFGPAEKKNIKMMFRPTVLKDRLIILRFGSISWCFGPISLCFGPQIVSLQQSAAVYVICPPNSTKLSKKAFWTLNRSHHCTRQSHSSRNIGLDIRLLLLATTAHSLSPAYVCAQLQCSHSAHTVCCNFIFTWSGFQQLIASTTTTRLS